jgi:hypothetical protein
MVNFFMKNFTKIVTKKKTLMVMTLILVYSYILTFFPNSEFTGLLTIEDELIGNDTVLTRPKWSEIFFERFYFVLVTTSAVGYGDVIPKSRRLKMINSVYLILIIYVMFEM